MRSSLHEYTLREHNLLVGAVLFLQEPSSIEKVAEIDSHIGVAMSGLTADARTLVDHGRVEAQQHSFTYNEPMPVESLTQSLCDLALRFGEDEEEGSMVRWCK